MAVRLVAITSGIGPLEGKSAEEVISYAARVSSPDNQEQFETAPRLLAYCIRHKHNSIFETASMTLEITTSRAIAAQLLRHRSFFFQETSQRYAEAHSNTCCHARRQDTKNRQNSTDDLPGDTVDWFDAAQQGIWEHSHGLYQEALKNGVAKECARFLLPLSTQTTLYMTGSIRSWMHYIELRSGNGTQLEHQQIAQQAKGIFVEQLPNIAKALGWEGQSLVL